MWTIYDQHKWSPMQRMVAKPLMQRISVQPFNFTPMAILQADSYCIVKIFDEWSIHKILKSNTMTNHMIKAFGNLNNGQGKV